MKFYIRKKLIVARDIFKFEDENDHIAYASKEKLIRFRNKMTLADAAGNDVAYVKKKLVHVMDHYEIETMDGKKYTLHQKMRLVRKVFSIEMPDGSELDLDGDIFAWDFSVKNGKQELMTMKKKAFRIADTYVIEITNPSDVPLMLALVLALDDALHDSK